MSFKKRYLSHEEVHPELYSQGPAEALAGASATASAIGITVEVNCTQCGTLVDPLENGLALEGYFYCLGCAGATWSVAGEDPSNDPRAP